MINNQVGFTTDPAQGRSTPYCTDLAKAFNLPVFHVNGDDPEAVVHVCELAAEWRATFKTDVVIDLVCYRKYGHNEIDEPSFTQPLMYTKIAQLPSALVSHTQHTRTHTQRTRGSACWTHCEVGDGAASPHVRALLLVRPPHLSAVRDDERTRRCGVLEPLWHHHIMDSDTPHLPHPSSSLTPQSLRTPSFLPSLPSPSPLPLPFPSPLPLSFPSVQEKYQKALKEEGTASEEEMKAISDKVNRLLDKAYEESKKLKVAERDWFQGSWSHMVSAKKFSEPRATGVDLEELREIGLKASTPPQGFHVHPRLAQVYKLREKTIQEGKHIDWGTAEALAFGSLLLENKHVRLSGQDVERGTFSHRHAVLHDQKSNERYVPLNNIRPDAQAHFTVTNSHLSEYGVLGFELGFSLDSPDALVLWEAQFGDFFNTAQVIVDQFISSGEDKWLRQTGLVMLLPHGYEGAGPEHSSARIERFLQMTNDHPDVIPPREGDKSKQIQQANWQLVNCSTPANFFHVLRRQIHRQFRKPLVVFTPKMLLRFAQAKSSLEEMGPDSRFMKVYGETDDAIAQGEQVQRVLLCSGKVYYDLYNERAERKLQSVAIVRLEQLSPFPFHDVAAELNKYPSAEVVWAQEEPMNMGAYVYAKDRVESTLRQLCGREGERVRYVGRHPSASTAAGHMSQHAKELKEILQHAYEGL